MSREEASRRLERLPNGTYLIRVSQSDMRRGEYALSIKYGRGHPVKHIKLQRAPDSSFFLADCKMFRNIVDLVQYYQQNSLESSFPEVPTVLRLAYKDALAWHTGAAALPDDPDVICYCCALYDYMAMEPNQISLRRGDRIAVTSKAGASRGWWKGRLDGKVGYFPSAFVTEADDDGLFFMTSSHHR
jgi:guanine nucleotide exchange factor VAV